MMQAEHHNSNWGTTGPKYGGAQVVRLLDERPYIRTVLDFGCGKGELGRYVQSQLPGRVDEWYNYDPGNPEFNKLPPEDRKFDMVLSTDVLEHIEPHKLEDTIRQLAKWTKLVLYSNIACYPTLKYFRGGTYDGQDLHLIVEEPEWWRNKITLLTGFGVFEYKHVERRRRGGFIKRCEVIHERQG
jgi:hypothetical protein